MFQSLCQLKMRELGFYTSSPISLWLQITLGVGGLDINSWTLRFCTCEKTKQLQQPRGGVQERQGQGAGLSTFHANARRMRDGPEGQLKDPCDLAEAPTVSTTASIHQKGFPKPEAREREMGPLRDSSASPKRALSLRRA